MDASMEPGIWLGRTEESDEHLVGTSRGVQRCRTVRRREESNQWDHRLFAEVKGVPWNLTLEAVARGRPKKVFVHFAAPLPEVVPQKDGTLRTFAETEVQTEKEKEDSEFSYPPTSPATTPQQEAESDGSEKEKSEAAGVAPPGSSQPVLPAAKKRTAEDSKEALSSPTKKVALPVPTGTKRSPEIPAEALDPRAPSGDGGDEGEESEGGVLQVFTHVDEASPELPEESYIHLEEDVSLNTGLDDHPDTWSDEKWAAESFKGKAKELSRLKHYGVYIPVPRSEARGKYVTTRWEEIPKHKDGKWIVRSRFVAREFRWQQPNRDDIFGVTSSSNTSRVLDLLLAKNPGHNAYISDVECAFFHAVEDELCYVEAPREWLEEVWETEDTKTDWVWQLAKQLYGRQKAPRQFGDHAAYVIVDEVGCRRCPEVPHLYFHEEEGVALEVHVDDFYAVGPGHSAKRVLEEIAKHLTMKIEGPFNEANPEFVHLKRRRTITSEGVWIQSAEGHLKKLLELNGLSLDSKTRETPVTKAVIGSPEDELLEPEHHTQFRAGVGVLMYMSTDRPDIQHTVNELACLMSKPTKRAAEAMKHLCRYLLHTKDYGLLFSRDLTGCDDVTVMTDSDWATDVATRKSRSAVQPTLFLHSTAVSNSSKLWGS